MRTALFCFSKKRRLDSPKRQDFLKGWHGRLVPVRNPDISIEAGEQTVFCASKGSYWIRTVDENIPLEPSGSLRVACPIRKS